MAMANMNMIIHDMEGEIQIGDTFRKPKFGEGNRLRTFDRVVANPMWNQTEFKEKDYDADELDRFPKGAGYPGSKADWGWMQHVLASLKPRGRAAVVLDTGAASRGSGNANSNKERDVRKWFVEQDVIDGVLDLPENLFDNTTAPVRSSNSRERMIWSWGSSALSRAAICAGLPSARACSNTASACTIVALTRRRDWRACSSSTLAKFWVSERATSMAMSRSRTRL